MSDLLIHGMEMPTITGTELYIRFGSDGKTYAIDTNAETTDGEWHEIVPVPPHGRLIDAQCVRDAIVQEWMDKADDSHMYKRGMEDAYEVIRNAPTIIPASE